MRILFTGLTAALALVSMPAPAQPVPAPRVLEPGAAAGSRTIAVLNPTDTDGHRRPGLLASGARKALHAEDARHLAAARLLLKTGSTIDSAGDGQSGGTVIDIFNSYIAMSGVNATEDGSIFLHIPHDSAGLREALIRLTVDAAFGDGLEG